MISVAARERHPPQSVEWPSHKYSVFDLLVNPSTKSNTNPLSRRRSTLLLLVTAIVDGLMGSMPDHIDGKTETFALIPNQEPASSQAQEEMSDDET